MRIFETHSHLDFEDFDKDRDKLINKCREMGIEKMINIGIDEETSRNSIALAEKYDFIYASAGYHPHDARKYDENVLKTLLSHKKVIAIGEIGLDYYRNLSPKNVQKVIFRNQLKIAHEYDLPVIVHDRDAHEDCYDILKESGVKKVVFHCFSGDDLFAEKILEEGWFISFTGTITFKNSRLTEVVRLIPGDRFFVETDSPFLAPVPVRGKRNSPLNLIHIINKIASIKDIPAEEIAEMSYRNAMKFFFDDL